MQVDISLLGATPETSDAVMRRPQHPARASCAGVRLLQERGVRVKLNTLLLDLNIAERQQMLDLALELGVYYEQVFKMSPADDGTLATRRPGASYRGADGPRAGGRRHAIHAASAPRRRAHVPGRPLIVPDQPVRGCVSLHRAADSRGPPGWPRQQRFAEIWAGAPILRQLRFQHTFNNLPECRVCPINAYCEGRCSGLAWKEHGDPYGGHSLACQHAQARYAQQHPGEPIPETPLQARLAGRPAVSKEERGQPIHLSY